jgi:hypothetical protein
MATAWLFVLLAPGPIFGLLSLAPLLRSPAQNPA